VKRTPGPPRQTAHKAPPTWRRFIKRAAPFIVSAVTIYLVLPRVVGVLGAWPRLSRLNPWWFGVGALAEAVSLSCTFALQRLALKGPPWFVVVTSGLTSNAITNTVPGADAVGAAVQLRMLRAAAVDIDTAVTGLAATSFLQVSALLALPLFSLPTILGGAPVARGLAATAVLGAVAFVISACARTDCSSSSVAKPSGSGTGYAPATRRWSG
jgi:hypothetical protein